jgi:hypothetical protein
MKLRALGYLPFVLAVCALGAVTLGPSVLAQGPPSPDERVAALKKSLQDNAARLHQYEWIETTSLSLKGEEKSRKQQRCYYGADGKLQKVDVSPAAAKPAPAAGGGGRGGRVKERVVENKKDEMKDYMEKAAALIHSYVPPNPAQIQKAKDAGKLTVKPMDGGRVRLAFSGYQQPGDSFLVDIDGAAALLAGLSVSTYLDKKEDAVNLNVDFGKLTDGTSYPAKTTLDVKAKNIRVVIENSGHRPVTR